MQSRWTAYSLVRNDNWKIGGIMMRKDILTGIIIDKALDEYTGGQIRSYGELVIQEDFFNEELRMSEYFLELLKVPSIEEAINIMQIFLLEYNNRMFGKNYYREIGKKLAAAGLGEHSANKVVAKIDMSSISKMYNMLNELQEYTGNTEIFLQMKRFDIIDELDKRKGLMRLVSDIKS